MPTWKPGSDSNTCAVCTKIIRHRKHHCRVCGEIVCADCSKSPRAFYIEDDFADDRPEVTELFEFGREAVIDINVTFPVSSSRQHYEKQYDVNLRRDQAYYHNMKEVVPTRYEHPNIPGLT
ncbi:MAG: hypothetical protein GY750_07635 [Lentisphaerae bacterium]|nr:hypothetical protein [Lentisphaerota bacterium]MCP4101279.1 hypothetical protein [Lentisphaerota bacterium]